MDEPEEDCALCGLLLASGDVITLKRKGGIATCNQGRIQSNVVGGVPELLGGASEAARSACRGSCGRGLTGSVNLWHTHNVSKAIGVTVFEI